MKKNSTGQIAPKIRLADTDIEYTDPQQSILECLEAKNIEIHYHCRDGFCGACRVKLVKGQVCYPQGEPLAYVADDEILTCCCIPVTDIILALDD